ncbi:hypothetical protein CROQUDRAFT_717453 [Cronartium quercuum f. sp. fusiforme G11]|uniref:Uncharacterized protein n=1 Tax=Cronartium quercuum f. sp. fusiforme G11 TaxID=708437 RepID=A0A9P6NFR7_9BASI|nr:hypothetical protein CROQUDRAFT_717453 [Cronartium quercuum f. sp. fusiforme G11]
MAKGNTRPLSQPGARSNASSPQAEGSPPHSQTSIHQSGEAFGDPLNTQIAAMNNRIRQNTQVMQETLEEVRNDLRTIEESEATHARQMEEMDDRYQEARRATQAEIERYYENHPQDDYDGRSSGGSTAESFSYLIPPTSESPVERHLRRDMQEEVSLTPEPSVSYNPEINRPVFPTPRHPDYSPGRFTFLPDTRNTFSSTEVSSDSDPFNPPKVADGSSDIPSSEVKRVADGSSDIPSSESNPYSPSTIAQMAEMVNPSPPPDYSSPAMRSAERRRNLRLNAEAEERNRLINAEAGSQASSRYLIPDPERSPIARQLLFSLRADDSHVPRNGSSHSLQSRSSPGLNHRNLPPLSHLSSSESLYRFQPAPPNRSPPALRSRSPHSVRSRQILSNDQKSKHQKSKREMTPSTERYSSSPTPATLRRPIRPSAPTPSRSIQPQSNPREQLSSSNTKPHIPTPSQVDSRNRSRRRAPTSSNSPVLEPRLTTSTSTHVTKKRKVSRNRAALPEPSTRVLRPRGTDGRAAIGSRALVIEVGDEAGQSQVNNQEVPPNVQAQVTRVTGRANRGRQNAGRRTTKRGRGNKKA